MLVSPPSDLVGYSRRFARWYWMPEPVRKAMQTAIEERYGVRWEELEVGRVAPRLAAKALVIHDRDDRMMPWTHGAEVAQSWPGAQLMLTDGLGHGRILRDERVEPRRGGLHLRMKRTLEVKWEDPVAARASRTLDGRHRIPARDPRRPAAAPADLRAARLTP